MYLKIFFTTILLSISLFAIQEEKLSKKEASILFFSMMDKTINNYYYRHDLNILKILEHTSNIKNNTLSKHNLFQIYNRYLDKKNGFYTKEEILKNFKPFLYDTSTFQIKIFQDITYFNLQAFISLDLVKLKRELKLKCPKKIILDFRNNRYTDIKTIVKLANIFTNKGIILSHKYIDEKGKDKVEQYKADKNSTLCANSKIAILTNNKTASSAEVVAHSLKSNHNITTIGQDSAGDSNYYKIGTLNKDSFFAFENGEFFYNDFLVTHNIGLKPDIRVKEHTPNEDKTLAKAIEFLNTTKDTNNNISKILQISSIKSKDINTTLIKAVKTQDIEQLRSIKQTNEQLPSLLELSFALNKYKSAKIIIDKIKIKDERFVLIALKKANRRMFNFLLDNNYNIKNTKLDAKYINMFLANKKDKELKDYLNIYGLETFRLKDISTKGQIQIVKVLDKLYKNNNLSNEQKLSIVKRLYNIKQINKAYIWLSSIDNKVRKDTKWECLLSIKIGTPYIKACEQLKIKYQQNNNFDKMKEIELLLKKYRK